MSTIAALASALGVGPGELFGGVKGLSSEGIEAGKLFQALPHDARDAVVRLMRVLASKRRT